jgi:hypothetical protein
VIREHLLWVFENFKLLLDAEHEEDLLLQILFVVEYVLLVVLITDKDVAELVDTLRFV